MLYHQIDASMRKLCFLWPLLSNISRYYFVFGKNSELPFQPLCFDWFLSGWEWILNFVFCLLKLLIFHQKLLWNIRSRLNSSTFWVFRPVFRYVWSKLKFFAQKMKIFKNSKCKSDMYSIIISGKVSKVLVNKALS